MIHQVQVQFFLKDSLVFIRKETSSQIQQKEQYKFLVLVDRQKITFLKTQQQPICRIYISPYQVSINQSEAIFYFVNKKNDTNMEVCKIKGSKVLLDDIYGLTQIKKYKSCLSFVPSTQTNISMLSQQYPTQKFRGFLNLAGIMFVILNLRNIIDNFFKYGTLFHNAPTEFITLDIIPAFVVLFVLFPIIAYELQKLKFKRIIGYKTTSYLVKLNLLLILAFNIFYCRYYQPLPIPGMTFTSLTIVILLKLVSYYQVNQQLFKILDRLNDLRASQFTQYMFAHHQISDKNLNYIKQNQNKWQNMISIKKLYYFLAAPTLCYQLQYPQTKSIRRIWLLKRIVQFCFMLTLQLLIWVQYIHPYLSAMHHSLNRQSYSYLQILQLFLKLSIPNTIMWIAGFYSFFHLLLNITGQLLCFADRKFYEDWWNCKNLQEYWKLWNLPVHFWFIRHAYNPLLQRKFKKAQAMLIVFFFSALAHEYVVSISLGFFGYYAFLAMLMQAPTIFVQKKIQKMFNLHSSQLGNVSFWLSFCIIGQPICVFIYYSQYMTEKAL